MSRDEGLHLALRALRERSGMSQAALSEGAGTSQGQVSAYELGKAEPGFSVLARLLRTMGFDFGHLEDALRAARGEPPRQPRPTAGDAPPGFEAVMDHVRDEAVTREVDRRLAHMLREVLGFDPRTGSGGPGEQRETGGRRS